LGTLIFRSKFRLNSVPYKTVSSGLNTRACRGGGPLGNSDIANKIARSCQRKKVKKGAVLYKKGDKDNRILLITGKAILKAGKRTKTIAGTDVIGECEFFTENNPNPGIRLHSATAKEAMDVIYIDPDLLREVPVIVDNIRRIICSRSTGIYRDIPFLDSPC